MSATVLNDEQLSARIRELSAARNMSVEDTIKLIEDHATLTASVSTLTASITEKDTAITAKDTEITTLLAKIKEREDADKSATRLASLEKILAFTDDEKKAETFVEFVKNLASLSDTDFEVLALRRNLAERDSRPAPAPQRILSGLSDNPQTNPVPQFAGADGTSRAAEVSDLY